MKPKRRKIKQSTRHTSKLALGINTGLCWCVAFYSLYTGQGAAVVGSCLALIGALYGSYVGVGHLDYRRLLACLTRQEETQDTDETDGGTVDRTGFWLEPDDEYFDEEPEDGTPSRTDARAGNRRPLQKSG